MTPETVVSQEPELTEEDWAGIMASDEPTDEEMELSNRIAANYEEQQELPD